MSLDDIVLVNITAQTLFPTRAGFGIPLIVGFHTNFNERARSYTGLSALVSDGFVADTPIYNAVSSVFQQNPSLPRVIVGRSENDSVQLVRITPVAANETLYSIKLLGITSQYTSDSSATVAEITAGLKAAIETNQSLSSITITDSGTHLDLQGVDTLVRFSVSVNSYTLLQQLDLTADAGGANGIAADLTAIKEQTDEWYVLNPTNLGKDVQIAAAAWTETQKKIMLSSTADYDVLDPNEQVNDLFSKLSIYARTAMQWSHVSGEKFLGAGWGGTVLPYTPGKATWKFKTLNGTETTPLSDTDKATIEAKGGNWYVTEAGLDITGQGKVMAGEFIDVVRGLDWTGARIQEAVFGLLATRPKIPYTDPGAALVQGKVQGVLDQGVTNELYTGNPAPATTVPLISSIPEEIRAIRLLPDVNFTATLAGAIHSVQVNGTVSV